MAAPGWRFFECTKTQLSLDTVLVCGQSFRWKQNGFGEWLGVLSGQVWRLKQTNDKILYKVHGPESFQSSSVTDQASKTNTENAKKQILEKRKVSLGSSCKTEVSSCGTEMKTFGAASSGRSRKGADKVASQRVGSSEKQNGATHTEIKAEILVKVEDSELCLQTSSKGSVDDTNSNHNDESFKILHNYFQLGIDLDAMYKHWSAQDPHFAKVASHFRGIRMLRQDPVENLLSFVCSSNNHISRISSMVEKLCKHYGDFITTVDGEEYYSFPSLSALCGDNVETHLRELGFGYRAKFISSIARHVTHEKGGDNWVRSLRGKSYLEAKKELTSLLGVGAKVADCVCLMSLDQPGAIPVDTHVWQITIKHYMAKLNNAKSLTDKIYNEIGTFYRDLWGPYAGWAHSVLFTADLKQNKEKAALVENETKPKGTEKKEFVETPKLVKKGSVRKEKCPEGLNTLKSWTVKKDAAETSKLLRKRSAMKEKCPEGVSSSENGTGKGKIPEQTEAKKKKVTAQTRQKSGKKTSRA